MDNCCRICLDTHKTLLSLQTEIEFEGTSIICSEMFYRFTGLQDIAMTDKNIPRKICISCFTELNSSFKFQQKAIESFKTLLRFQSTKTCNKIQDAVHHIETDGDSASLSSEEHHDNKLETLSLKVVNDSLVSKVETDDVYMEEFLDEEFTENYDNNDQCKYEIKDDDQTDGSKRKKRTNTLDKEDYEEGLNVDKQEYNCKLCSQISNSRSELDSHFVAEHCQQLSKSEFICSICKRQFKSRKTLRQHCRIHRDYESRRFRCRFCSKAFNYGHHLKIHETTHTMEKPFSCQFCSKHFASKDRLKNHELQHVDEHKYKCETCNSLFKSRKAHKMHAILKHDAAVDRFDPIECHKCSKTLYSKSAASAHFKGACVNNHEEFPNNNTKKREYTCRQCNQFFSSPSTLRVHRKINHSLEAKDRTYVCEICEQCFEQSIHLKTHMKTHTGDKASFCTNAVTHTEDVRFDCTQCHRKYKFKASLNNHIKLCHNGEQQ